MSFSEAEVAFLKSQKIGRLATSGSGGWPHVMPVMYEVHDDGDLEFDADGVKLRNIEQTGRAALVVDAMGPKRGVSVQGEARVVGFERVRLTPKRHFSWGL